MRSEGRGRWMLPLVLPLLCCQACGAGDRRANAFEYTYSYLAAELQMPELCEKISTRAYLTAPLSGGDTQITYTRSECYYHLALKMGQVSYCRFVVPKTHLILEGKGMSEEACKAQVALGGGLNGSGGDEDLLTRFLGYKDGDFPASTDPTGDRMNLYGDLPHRPDTRERAMLLPDFSVAGPAVVSGFSDEMLGCKDAHDPHWFCFSARCLESSDVGYRDSCLEIGAELKRLSGQEFARPPTPYVRDLLRNRRLRDEFTAAASAAPRLREEAKQAQRAAEAESKAATERNTRHRRVTFEEVDQDHDGSLTLAEFTATPNRHFKPSDADFLWERLFKPWDADHNGAVSEREFAAAPGESKAVQTYDLNRDGRCTVDEIRRAVARSSPGIARGKFQFIDIDANGLVSKAEYEDDKMIQDHYLRRGEASRR